MSVDFAPIDVLHVKDYNSVDYLRLCICWMAREIFFTKSRNFSIRNMNTSGRGCCQVRSF